jgi:hypothetical protein
MEKSEITKTSGLEPIGQNDRISDYDKCPCGSGEAAWDCESCELDEDLCDRCGEDSPEYLVTTAIDAPEQLWCDGCYEEAWTTGEFDGLDVVAEVLV